MRLSLNSQPLSTPTWFSLFSSSAHETPMSPPRLIIIARAYTGESRGGNTGRKRACKRHDRLCSPHFITRAARRLKQEIISDRMEERKRHIRRYKHQKYGGHGPKAGV